MPAEKGNSHFISLLLSSSRTENLGRCPKPFRPWGLYPHHLRQGIIPCTLFAETNVSARGYKKGFLYFLFRVSLFIFVTKASDCFCKMGQEAVSLGGVLGGVKPQGLNILVRQPLYLFRLFSFFATSICTFLFLIFACFMPCKISRTNSRGASTKVYSS